MKNSFAICVFILFSIFSIGQNIETTDFSIGDRLSFYSKTLDQQRVLNVYLPLGYSPDSAYSYPVIYILDGSAHEDFIHIAGLTQFCAYDWIKMLPKCILVGIENVNRYHDFTYPTDLPEYQEFNPVAGGSPDFIEFLKNEVKPLVESKYLCNGSSTIIGQSLGGLLATEILYKQPELFNNYIIVSPSLWWDEQSLFEIAINPFEDEKQILIAVGNEGRVMKHVARKLNRELKRSLNKNCKVKFKYLPNHDHGDVLHQAAYWAFDELEL